MFKESLKKLAVTLLAVCMSSAVVAGGAQAAGWQLEGGSGLAGESVNVKQVDAATLTSKILGQTVKLEGTANNTPESKLNAGGGVSGELSFTGVTVGLHNVPRHDQHPRRSGSDGQHRSDERSGVCQVRPDLESSLREPQN